MNKGLWILSASLFIWGMGEGLFLYFQPLALQHWGADPTLIGIIMGVGGIAMTAGQIPAGWLSDRIGPRKVMWVSWITATVTAWMMAIATSLSTFAAGLLAYNLTSFVVAPLNAYATSLRGNWSVGRALTVVSASFNLGAVIGPVVGGLIGERYGIRSIYTISAAIFIFSTLTILTAPKVKPESHVDNGENTHILRNGRFLVFVGIALLTSFSTYLPQPLASLFLQNVRGISLVDIGWLGAMASLGNALLSLAFGHLAPMAAMLLGQALVGVFALLLWRGSGMLWYGIGFFCMGGFRLARTMYLAIARSLVRGKETGVAYGILETANAAAVIAAPPVAGLLYEGDPARVFMVSAIVILAVIGVNSVALPRLRPLIPSTILQEIIPAPDISSGE